MPSQDDRAPSVSPIELLLPRGYAETAMVLGSDCPAALLPSAHSPHSGEAPVDLVVLAPSRDESRDAVWVDHSAERTVRELSPTGTAYILPASARRLRGVLAAHGLDTTDLLLHVPDPARSRHVVPVGTEAQRYALSGRLAMTRGKRLAAGAVLRSRLLAALGPTGVFVRRHDAPPLAAWLFDLGPRAAAGSTLVSVSGTRAGTAVLLRFPAGTLLPDAVAKVSPRAPRELEALLALAPTAARAGVRVPGVLSSGTLGKLPMVLETPVDGNVVARLLERRRITPGALQEQLAEWLARWGRLSRRVRAIDDEDLERLVLSPAARLLPEEQAYRAYLAELCAEVAGTACPFTASHGDLTSTNILLNDSHQLGIIDWEVASHESLPLMDFFYAAADAVAAAGGYDDRPGSVVDCFARDGRHTEHVTGLIRQLSASLDVSPKVQEVCFHACWLHHARNEADYADRGPFLAITEMVAREPDRFWRRGSPGTRRR